MCDEWAQPLPSDVGEALLLRPLLKQTQLEFLPLALAFDAAAHGWSAAAFHSRLDGLGAAILVAETAFGEVFGGYNSKGWLGYGDWRDAISAFLYVLSPPGAEEPAEKLAKVGGSGMAIIDEAGGSPTWGPDGLKVSLEARSARSRLGSYYARRRDGSRTLWSEAQGPSTSIISVRVYVGLGETAKAAGYKPSLLQWQPGELEAIRAGDERSSDS